MPRQRKAQAFRTWSWARPHFVTTGVSLTKAIPCPGRGPPPSSSAAGKMTTWSASRDDLPRRTITLSGDTRVWAAEPRLQGPAARLLGRASKQTRRWRRSDPRMCVERASPFRSSAEREQSHIVSLPGAYLPRPYPSSPRPQHPLSSLRPPRHPGIISSSRPFPVHRRDRPAPDLHVPLRRSVAAAAPEHPPR